MAKRKVAWLGACNKRQGLAITEVGNLIIDIVCDYYFIQT